MDYAIVDSVTTYAGKVLNHGIIERTFRSIEDARRYIIAKADKNGSNILKITSKGIYYVGMVFWTSYPKNGKTAFAWGYHKEGGGLWFVNKDGTLGKPMPYSTWHVVDGKQVWYTTDHKKKKTEKLPFGL